MSKLVVTGATGHLGPYVVAAALARGHHVVAASRDGRLPEAPWGTRFPGGPIRPLALDITGDASVEVLTPELGPDVTLLHLAAWHPPATASTTAADRTRLLETNVLGTMRVLDAARHAKVRAVVYASSFEVYGDVADGDITEETRTHPLTDYGATKRSGEHHLKAFSQEERVRTAALRMPAIYGPGELTSRALPNFLRAVARGERPCIAGDGGDVRDELHARDAASAVLLAAEGDAQGVFNVADGERHSIAEMARTAMRVAEMPGEPRVVPREKPRRDYHMRVERAREALGFTPSVMLEAGMREQFAWVRATGPRR